MPSDSPSHTLPTPSPPNIDPADSPGELLPVVLMQYSGLPASESAGVITTMNLADRGQAIALQRILAGESESLWDVEGSPLIRIEHITAHFAVRVDEETGEVIGKKFLTLSGPDGVYHTASEWAYRDLQRAALLTGWKPGTGYLCIQPARAKTRKGNTRQVIYACQPE